MNNKRFSALTSAIAGGEPHDPNLPVGPVNARIFGGTVHQKEYPVCFDGSQSTGVNPMGGCEDIFGIRSYRWDFGDGSPAEMGEYLSFVTHAYQSAGYYTVTLWVTDYRGGEAVTKAEIKIVDHLPCVRTEGFDASAIISAIETLDGKAGIVRLDAGVYEIHNEIEVPANILLEGSGAAQTILSLQSGEHIFKITSDNIRITGLAMKGPGELKTAVVMSASHNLLVDHCDIYGFSIANDINIHSSAFFLENAIHNNPRDGLGYGIMVVSGAYVLARGNTFSNNRHSIASGGLSSQTGWNTGYDCIGNLLTIDTDTHVDVFLDTHAGTQGRMRVVGNTFRDIQYAIGFRDGWGEIKDNTFENVSQYICKFDIPLYSNGRLVENGGCHDFIIGSNTMTNCGVYWLMLYGTGNIALNGRNIDSMIPYEGNDIW